MSRTVVVTGGAKGIGLAIVERFTALGDEVVGLSHSDLDVTDEDAVARVFADIGDVDVLVNNAGIAGPTFPVTDYPPDAWHQVISVNLGGVFHCTRACLPHMIARGYGRIVNIASIAGKDGNPEMSAYSASKAGVIAFTKSVAKEVARTGVLVNCLVPGVIDAGLTDRAPEGERQLFLSRIPMGRMGRPGEVAELVSWLASERCSFSTGAAFDLSGGRAVY